MRNHARPRGQGDLRLGCTKPLPPELWSGLEGRGYFSANPQNYPNGCYVAEVEIEPDTGEVTLAAVSGVDDVGTMINPLILEGQMHGGIAQAAGQALKERIVHSDDGQLLSGSFTDYAMPQARDFPRFRLGFRPVPTRTNPLGVKGGAETGTIGLPPAIAGAIVDALRPLGVTDITLPATAQTVWLALRDARERHAARPPGTQFQPPAAADGRRGDGDATPEPTDNSDA